MRPDITAIREAQERIRDLIAHTPTVSSPFLSEQTGFDVRLKLENLQPTGSFKVRGAASKILSIDPNAVARGVVTASTGNHGRAVAYVAAQLGVPATVCVSENVPPGKVAALEALGCELVVGGDSQTEGLRTAARLVEERGLTLIHPFDDPQVIAGQGTIGVEIAEQMPHVTAVLVPLSGGGLASGVAAALDALLPTVRTIGVSMERGAVMASSLDAGGPVELPEESTLADSLQGGIGMDNHYTFDMCQSLLDQVVLVSEQEIWEAMRSILDRHRMILEGGGAVGVAAVLAGKIETSGPVAIICSGANAEPGQVRQLATEL